MPFSAGAVSVDIRTGKNYVKSDLERLGSIAAGVGKKIGAVVGVTGLAAFSKGCIDAASAAQQTANRVATVFPQMQGQVNAFAATAVEKMGMGAGAAKKMTAQFGMMAQGMGMSERASAEMGATMTKLAGDMAAFKRTGRIRKWL